MNLPPTLKMLFNGRFLCNAAFLELRQIIHSVLLFFQLPEPAGVRLHVEALPAELLLGHRDGVLLRPEEVPLRAEGGGARGRGRGARTRPPRRQARSRQEQARRRAAAHLRGQPESLTRAARCSRQLTVRVIATNERLSPIGSDSIPIAAPLHKRFSIFLSLRPRGTGSPTPIIVKMPHIFGSLK